MRAELGGHQARIFSITFANSDTILVTASDAVRTWDVEQGALLHEIRAQHIRDVIGSPRHSFVVCVGDHGPDTTAIVCDAELGNCFPLPTSARAAAFMPDGSSFLTDSRCEVMKLWDLRPLLERRESGSEDESIPSGETDLVDLVGTTLSGPQVRPSSSCPSHP